MAGKWWEGNSRSGYNSRRRRRKKKKKKKSSVRDFGVLQSDAETAAEDLADTINENNEVLGPLCTTGAILIAQTGRSVAKSFNKVLEWGWPSE